MMDEWRERLADADRRAGNAWLLTAVLVVALVCAGETLGAVASGTMPGADAACSFTVVAATMLMAFRPVTGAFAVTVLWSALSVAAVAMPSAMLLCVLAAIGILGYAYRRAAVAVAIIALSVWIFTQGGVGLPSWSTGTGSSYSGTTDSSSADGQSDASGQTDTSSTDGTANPPDKPTDPNDHVLLGTVAMSGIAPVVVLFVGFLLGGMAARWNHERHSERMELAYRRQRARVAQDIHDYVSNDLAYLILRLDKDIADGRSPGNAELRELRDVASGALDRTHQVIGVIEGREDRPRTPAVDDRQPVPRTGASPLSSIADRSFGAAGNDVTSTSAWPNAGIGSSAVNLSLECDDCPLAARLRTIAQAGDHRLAELGFDGQSIITDANGTAGEDELIAGLLEELYGNVAKHADPAGGYVLTIGIGMGSVRIALVDTMLADMAAINGSAAGSGSNVRQSLGSGLSRYRARIAERGGTMSVAERTESPQDGEWAMSAMIPLVG